MSPIFDYDYPSIPMRNPCTADWNLQISPSDYELIAAGQEIYSSDDKWRVIPTGHIESGNISVLWTRAGGEQHYKLDIEPSKTDSNFRIIKTITWEQSYNEKMELNRGEEEAKDDIVWMSRIQLSCDIDAVPKTDLED